MATSNIEVTRLVEDVTIDQKTECPRNPSMFNIGMNVAFHVPATTIAKTGNIFKIIIVELVGGKTPKAIIAPKVEEAMT
jgi:hypothetical protein